MLRDVLQDRLWLGDLLDTGGVRVGVREGVALARPVMSPTHTRTQAENTQARTQAHTSTHKHTQAHTQARTQARTQAHTSTHTMHAHKHTSTHKHAEARTSTHTSRHKHAQARTSTHTSRHKQAQAGTSRHTSRHKHAHKQAQAHTNTHTSTHKHAHKHAQARTQARTCCRGMQGRRRRMPAVAHATRTHGRDTSATVRPAPPPLLFTQHNEQLRMLHVHASPLNWKPVFSWSGLYTLQAVGMHSRQCIPSDCTGTGRGKQQPCGNTELRQGCLNLGHRVSQTHTRGSCPRDLPHLQYKNVTTTMTT
jgi:hypothetical protein